MKLFLSKQSPFLFNVALQGESCLLDKSSVLITRPHVGASPHLNANSTLGGRRAGVTYSGPTSPPPTQQSTAGQPFPPLTLVSTSVHCPPWSELWGLPSDDLLLRLQDRVKQALYVGNLNISPFVSIHRLYSRRFDASIRPHRFFYSE